MPCYRRMPWYLYPRNVVLTMGRFQAAVSFWDQYKGGGESLLKDSVCYTSQVWTMPLHHRSARSSGTGARTVASAAGRRGCKSAPHRSRCPVSAQAGDSHGGSGMGWRPQNVQDFLKHVYYRCSIIIYCINKYN